jgi:hypothetical protein
MSSVERFLANLKRLFAPRTRPPAESVAGPTADRPPPAEAAPSREPIPRDVIPTVEVGPEVRAPFDPAVEAPEPMPAFSPATSQEPTDVSTAVTGRVGDALVLTLATPATSFTVARSGATLGRGQENTIRLDDLSVSRRHARFAYKQGGYWLSDLGSMGGTWVDGTRLNAPRRIAAGEVIDIGLCRLTVSFVADAGRAEMKKSASKPRLAMAEGRKRR